MTHKKREFNNILRIALNCFHKIIAMKKYFLLEIFYVICTITLLILFWELVLEGLILLDGHEILVVSIGFFLLHSFHHNKLIPFFWEIIPPRSLR